MGWARKIFLITTLALSSNCGNDHNGLDGSETIDWTEGEIVLQQRPIARQLVLKKVSNDLTGATSYELVGLPVSNDNKTKEYPLAFAKLHPFKDHRIYAYKYRLCVDEVEVDQVGKRLDVSIQLLHDVPDEISACTLAKQKIGSVIWSAKSQYFVITGTEFYLYDITQNEKLKDHWALSLNNLTPEIAAARNACRIAQVPASGVHQTPGQSDGKPGNPDQGAPNQGDVRQTPGQIHQGPSQTDVCGTPIPEVDLCGGSPMAEPCYERLFGPAADRPIGEDIELISGLSLASSGGNDATLATLLEPGVIEFRDPTIEATLETNTPLCQERFFAVARTLDSRVHDGCKITLQTTEPVDGALSCRVSVMLNAPRTFLQKVCDVQVGFYGESLTTKNLKIVSPE